MYISVIPLRASLSRDPSTYFVHSEWEDSIACGYLVEIPLGRQIVMGIIAEVLSGPPKDVAIEDIKAILRVIATVEIVNGPSLKIIGALARRYFLPIHKVASMFLPAPLLTSLDKKNYLLSPPGPIQTSTKGSISIIHTLEKVFQPRDIIDYLEDGSIFVFPDDTLLSFFEDSIPSRMRKDIGIIRSHQSSTKKVQSWYDIYSKKYDIIFGTRRLLYYNLHGYKKIYYIEDAFGREQFHYPIKIQSLDILYSLSTSNQFYISVISSSPTLRLFSLFPNAIIQSLRE